MWQKSNPLSEFHSRNNPSPLLHFHWGCPKLEDLSTEGFQKTRISLNTHRNKSRTVPAHSMSFSIFAQHAYFTNIRDYPDLLPVAKREQIISGEKSEVRKYIMQMYASLAGRSFRTSLQEVALQTRRLFKAMHRYRVDSQAKKTRLTPFKNPACRSGSQTCEVRRDHGDPSQCKPQPRDFHPAVPSLSP